jgi:DNA-binding CsgD family transcriptional regulator
MACLNLTARERECLELIAAGKRDGDVAGILHISTTTAKQHVLSATKKLGASNRAQAVVLALRSSQIVL